MNHVGKRLVIFIIVIAAVVLLQVVLSRRKNKWAGLFLPFVSFLFSFLYPFLMIQVVTVEGGFFLVEMGIVWIAANIKTFLLLAIYYVCHRSQKR